MAEPKTRPTDASVEDFLAAVPDARRREDAQAVAVMLGEVTGEPPTMWGPSIVGFGAYQGPTGAWPVIGLSPRKAELVVYVMPDFPEREAMVAALGKVRTGSSCLYIKRLDAIDGEALRALCAKSVEVVRDRYPAADAGTA